MKKLSFRNVFPVALAIASLTLSVSFALAKNSKGADDNGNGNNSSKEEKNNSGQSQKKTIDNSLNEKTANQGESSEIKNQEAKDSNNSNLNSGKNKNNDMEIEKRISDTLINGLRKVADAEEEAGNTQASKRLGTMIEQRMREQEQTMEAIGKIENRNKFRTFLTGTDYGSLGDLRSAMVQNRNQIRKLIQMLGQVQSGESESIIKDQIGTLLQERTNFKAIVQGAENQTSLFGWMLKIVNGYENGIYEEEEHELEQEVKDMVEQALDVSEIEDQQ